MAKSALIKQSVNYYEYHDFLIQSGKIPELKNSDDYLQQYSFFKSIMDVLPCTVYILNFATQEYCFVSESCKSITSYSADEFKNGGRNFFLSLVHKDDVHISATKIFNSFIEYTRHLGVDDIKKCRFSLNFRLKRKDGVYVKLLQQYVILEVNELGYPLLSLGVISDITAHKSDDKMHFSISHYDEKYGFKTISSNSYIHEEITLTPREKEIIKHIVCGRSTPEMAELLFISQHTIKTHRKNIFRKTNCKNIAELVNFAIVHGVI